MFGILGTGGTFGLGFGSEAPRGDRRVLYADLKLLSVPRLVRLGLLLLLLVLLLLCIEELALLDKEEDAVDDDDDESEGVDPEADPTDWGGDCGVPPLPLAKDILLLLFPE